MVIDRIQRWGTRIWVGQTVSERFDRWFDPKTNNGGSPLSLAVNDRTYPCLLFFLFLVAAAGALVAGSLSTSESNKSWYKLSISGAVWPGSAAVRGNWSAILLSFSAGGEPPPGP